MLSCVCSVVYVASDCFAELQKPFFVCCAEFLSSQQHHGNSTFTSMPSTYTFFSEHTTTCCVVCSYFALNQTVYTHKYLKTCMPTTNQLAYFLDFITSCWAAILLLFVIPFKRRCIVCLYTCGITTRISSQVLTGFASLCFCLCMRIFAWIN